MTDVTEHTPMLVASIFTIVGSSFWIDHYVVSLSLIILFIVYCLVMRITALAFF